MPSRTWGAAPRPEQRRLTDGLLQPPPAAAQFLLGQLLVRKIETEWAILRIVETEAYLGEGDSAAHAFHGRTRRTAPLWGPPGTWYVYLIYGMHHCLNVSAEAAETPGCVLIRAAEPLPGTRLDPLEGRGPGRLCRALGIDTRLSGASAFDAGSGLYLREGARPAAVATSPRIGIRQAADLPLRFFDPGSPAVSRAATPDKRRRGSP